MAGSDYIPRSVLLTGGAGFIGSHVLCHLVQRYPEAHFVCLDKLAYCASLRNLDEIMHRPNFTFVQGDIVDCSLVRRILEQYGVDTIIHFAAETHVDNSFGNSLEFTVTNVLGTHVLLESARLCKQQIRRFIHVSTDEVYGEAALEAVEPCTAASPLNPTNPYAATKVAAEFLVNSYRLSFNLPTIITRGNNVYGPRQYPEKLIPKFIFLLDRKQPCPLHGDGKNRRSYLYVSDVVEAFDLILRKGVPGTIYNIGSRVEVSNRDVLRALIRLFGLEKEEEKYTTFVKNRSFNDLRYHIDPTSLEELGWSAKVSFEDGLKRTVDWYLSHRDYWGDVRAALAPHPSFLVRSPRLSGLHLLAVTAGPLPHAPSDPSAPFQLPPSALSILRGGANDTPRSLTPPTPPDLPVRAAPVPRGRAKKDEKGNWTKVALVGGLAALFFLRQYWMPRGSGRR